MITEEYRDYALVAKDITKYYGEARVLDNMHFELRKGEIHSLLGANGAGKSTLLNILDGLIQDYHGTLYLNGEEIRVQNPIDAKAKGIGMVHQELTVLPNITIAENVFLGRLPKTKMGSVNWRSLNEQTKEVLGSLGLDIDPKMLLGSLTAADRQMVEIARIVAMNTPIILLDEPTSSLSEAEIQRLLDIIRKLQSDGKSIIFITHKIDEILAICDRVTVMKDGCFVETVELNDRTHAMQRALISKMIGSEKGSFMDMFPPKGGTPGEVMLEIDGLTKAGVFEDISLNVKAGEVVVLTGLKGAKRTETMRCVFGADDYDSGRVLVEGKDIGKTSIRKSLQNHVSMVTEDRKGEGIVSFMNVRDNISLATIEDCSKAGFVSFKKVQKKAEKYVDALSIKVASLMNPVTSLSGGNQQKVVLAKWLASNPKVLILDEPTRGIDVGAKVEIYKLIRKMTEEGAAVLVVSSEIPEVIGLADRVYVMREGKMMGELNVEEASNDKIMFLMFGEDIHKAEEVS